MMLFERIGTFFGIVFELAADPLHIAILFGSVMMGIIFGAMPGLTSTLGVALLTALTYGMDTATAMLCLLAIYVGGTYGGSPLGCAPGSPRRHRRRSRPSPCTSRTAGAAGSRNGSRPSSSRRASPRRPTSRR